MFCSSFFLIRLACTAPVLFHPLMKFSEIVGGSCDRLPLSVASNKDVIKFFFHHYESQKQCDLSDTISLVSCLIVNHYTALGLYSKFQKTGAINK